MASKLLSTLVFAALMAFAVYRRITRSIGRQRVSAPRLWFRAGLLSLLGVTTLLTVGRSTDLLAAMLLGAACGLALGVLGLRHTQFESTVDGNFYTPHTYIGLIVSALLVGRILYRLATNALDQNPYAAFRQSPVTLAIFGVLIGYYVFYNIGVWSHSRKLAAK